MYTIFTDSDTDITPAVAASYGYKLIIMPYTVNGKDVYPYVDFEKFDYKSFYDMLRGDVLPTTSALNPAEYKKYFEPEFEKGNDVLYVHFSKAMSGTFNSMEVAVNELKEKYPTRNFYTVDTKGITIGSLNIVEEIGKMYKDGKSVEEILKWAETEVDKFAVYFYADDVKFFKKSGRVSGLAATMSTIFRICPIIHMDSDGMMKSIGKERGRLKSLERLVKYVEELGDDVKGHKVIIGHSDALDIAETLGKMLKEKFGDDLNIEYVPVNPTAGSHCGPSSVGVSFHAIHR